MGQLFLIALRNLAQHRKRTLLLGGAIAGVTALLSFLLCLSAGIHATMLQSATTLATGHLNIGGFYKVTAGQSAPAVTEYKKAAEIVEKTLPDLDYWVARGRGWGKVVGERASMQAAIGGIEISREPGFRKMVVPVEGSIEGLSEPNTILIFQEQAKKLDVKVGDSLVISTQTTRGVYNTVDVRVIAIAKDLGMLSAWNVYIPEASLKNLLQFNAETTGAIQLYLKDMKRIPQDMDLLRNAFTANGYLIMDREAKAFWQKFESVNREDWTGQKLDITTWDEETSFLAWMVSGIDGLMFILTIILLIIISVGIMNSMWIAIRERTREIGTLRAIGMQRRRVLAMFMIEAFSLSMLSTIVGGILGILFSLGLDAAHIKVPKGAEMFLMSSTMHTALDPQRLLTGIILIIGTTTIIAIVPSIHAARMRPITAMSHVG